MMLLTMSNFLIALTLMWKGMLGIFSVSLIIMLAVWIMGKIK